MIFHGARQKHMINIKINKVHIEQTKHTQFLGVVFDDNLDWSNHISYINRKIAKGIGIICRAKQVLTSPPPAMGTRLAFFWALPVMWTRWMAGAVAHKSG